MSEASNIGTKMDVDETAIDEGLYSRQLWVFYIMVFQVNERTFFNG